MSFGISWPAMLVLSMAVVSSCETFYIIPVNSTESCETEPCYTLDQLPGELLNLRANYLALFFLPGQFFLSQQLSITSFANVKIISESANSEVSLQNNRIIMTQVQNLVIANLTIMSNNSIVTTGHSIRILESDSVSFERCVFVETLKSMILVVDSKSTHISDCVFKSTFSIDADTVYSVLSIYSTSLYIFNSEFFDTKHYIYDEYVPTIDVTNTNFINASHCTFVSHGVAGGGIRINSKRISSGLTYINNCTFIGNRLAGKESGVIYTTRPTKKFFLIDSTFTNNSVEYGGIIHILNSKILLINSCTFIYNYGKSANVIQATSTHSMSIISCEFSGNANSDSISAVAVEKIGNFLQVNDSTFVNNLGGGISVDGFGSDLVSFYKCEFRDNISPYTGGGISIAKSINIKIQDCIFQNNTGQRGGAIKVHIEWQAQLEINSCVFTGNYAINEWSGGALFSRESYVCIKNTLFDNNHGTDIVTIIQSAVTLENTSFINNQANDQRVLSLLQSTLIIRRLIFKYNRGCIYLFSNRVNVVGPATLSGNTGGSIRAVQSQLLFSSTEGVVISNNTASSGGGILLRESELVVRSLLNISENIALTVGGGIYAYQSVIDFSSTSRYKTGESIIVNNFAGQNGGGVYAVASSIKVLKFHVTIGNNTALVSGGGAYLQENSKIYVLKQDDELLHAPENAFVWLKIANNIGTYGGGIYVADSTNGDLQCQGEVKNDTDKDDASVSPDCFIQTIRLFTPVTQEKNYINTFIINNTAKSGSALYGGLLDRCTVSILAEVYDKEVFSGLHYINRTVMISNGSSIESDPVQVVFCNKHNHFLSIKKGGTFKLSVLAIDQVGNPLNATIHSSVVTKSGVGRLKEGQAKQRVRDQCTELEYNVFSQDSSAQVELYADGPCTKLGISRKLFSVYFLPCKCPIGFQPSPSQIECKCVCDQQLQPYQITNCSEQAETIKLETNIWIGVANFTNGTGYVIHDCPFDYCVEKPVNISLTSLEERDRQCAFNRSGVLCGECRQGLSLVLATSQCKKCSDTYILLLLPFALAGILLVVFILFFNITIATGTIHGLIFYSNLLPATYLTSPNALTVFISWVNLDWGFETCFYNGMRSQAKVLLQQLVFPAYLFLLMFLIIILSKYSNFFATLLSNRNPVAALSTLTFLSYSKLLRFIIAALQSTVLNFPGGLKRRVWQYDANVEYFTSSHTPRFVAAAFILVAGGLLTLQLFFAQWLPRCSEFKLMKWTRNTKYTAFIDAHHAPFTSKYRFWLGLLLLALIVHNIIVAMATNDFLPILSMGCIAIGLIILLKLFSNRVYKRWINDMFMTAFLLNLVFLAFGSFYIHTTEAKYLVTTLGNISIGVSVCLFLVIICYHSYIHVYLQSRFRRRHKMCTENITATLNKRLRKGPKSVVTSEQKGTMVTNYTAFKSCQQREPDLDVLAPITMDDYKPAPSSCIRPEVTHTVIERELDTITTEPVIEKQQLL